MTDFGRYRQHAESTDITPISWQILERTADECLLVSSRILDCRRYHDAPTQTTWRDSTMRQWLNGAFFAEAFSEAEQAIIVPTRCADNGPGTPDTVDRIFLLSVQEVRELTHPGQGQGLDRRSVGTSFAIQKKGGGCHRRVKGYGRVDIPYYGVRPAIKLDTSLIARNAMSGPRLVES